jgi:hypothetical protein
MTALFAAALALAPAAVAPPIDPAEIADSFDGQDLASGWTWFHQAYGWPNKLKVADVNRSSPGMLRMEPYHAGWVRDLNAPFLFKTVRGDFDVRARVRMRGADRPVPGGTWSLGGLMARLPNGLSAATWQPFRENWHFITTGVGYEAGKPVTETKGTYNSYSSLKLRPFVSEWVELRLVRVGTALFTMARPDGDTNWQLRDRFYRMEMNPFMQVGLIAYTNSPDVKPAPEDAATENRTLETSARVDAVFEVDWIRGQRPRASKLDYWSIKDGDREALLAGWFAQVNGTNKLSDPNLPEAEVLRLLGD